MANRTPHVVGGGLGTFRKEDTAKAIAAKQAQQESDRRKAMAKIANAAK